MTERKITPPAEQQRFLLQTLEDRLDRRNRAKVDQNPFLVKVADKGIFETYLDFVFVKIPDSTQPNGFRTVMNLDMARIANDTIKRYEPVPQAPIDSPVKPQKDADERLTKAAFNGVDMVRSLNQPVRVTVDGSTVAYDIGEKVRRENSMEMERIEPAKPNEISPAISPMQYEYDWGEEEDWSREVYPKTDLFGHSS